MQMHNAPADALHDTSWNLCHPVHNSISRHEGQHLALRRAGGLRRLQHGWPGPAAPGRRHPPAAVTCLGCLPHHTRSQVRCIQESKSASKRDFDPAVADSQADTRTNADDISRTLTA